MSVEAECPKCHARQAIKNKKCRKCEFSIDSAKRKGKVKYWIVYRLNNKKCIEFVGYNLQEAKDADGKRRVQKRGI